MNLIEVEAGQLRKWDKIKNDSIFLIISVTSKNGYCEIMDNQGTVDTWRCLDILSNSEVIDEAG